MFTAELPTASMIARFWTKVDKTDGCWNWTGSTNRDGYGKLAKPGKHGGWVGAHRFARELLVGPIPTGLVIDHLCRNRACVNPEHLEPVTHRVNILRGVSFAATNAKKTECPQGHPLSGDNLHVNPAGERWCRACHNARQRAGRAAKAVAS